MSAGTPDRAAVLVEIVKRLSRQKSVWERTNEIAKSVITFGHKLKGGMKFSRALDAPHGANFNELVEIEERTGKFMGRTIYDDDEADALIERAENDPLEYDAACEIAAGLVRQKNPLSPKAIDFVAGVLTGKITRPKHRGKYRGSYNMRDDAIVDHVAWVVQQGFPETRNDESDHRDSACDIVAEALAELHLSPGTYSRVKRIWLNTRVTD